MIGGDTGYRKVSEYISCIRTTRRNNHFILTVAFFSLFVFILLISSATFARTIWQIGMDDDNANEFGIPGTPDSDPNLIKNQVIDYWIIQDGNVQDWKHFPYRLWPLEAPFNPKEIHINYDYQTGYRCPILRIKAKSSVRNYTQRLIVLKEGSSSETLSADLPSHFDLFEFPLGTIEKGNHAKNKIIIKNISITTDNHSLLFDYLELDDQDQDGDGSLDSEEPEGDIDNDGIENILDADTATFLMENQDGSKSKWLTLDLKEEGDFKPHFTELGYLDTNSPDYPTELPLAVFFPFGLFKAKINISDYENIFNLQIVYPEDEIIYETAQFYLNIDNVWGSIPIEIVATNIIEISIRIDTEWQYDPNRYIEESEGLTIIGGLTYLEGLSITLDESECFINSIW